MKKNKNTTTFAPINHTWNLLKGKKRKTTNSRK